MNSDFQSDAQYFRGKTLTPESPVPLHIPEPHIPVLQNQIDPIWNLMSTHMDPPLAANSNVGVSTTVSQGDSGQAAQMNAAAAILNSEVTDQGPAPNGHEPDQGDKDYVLAFDNEDLTEELVQKQHADTFLNTSTNAAQPAASISVHETLSPRPQDDHSPLSSLNQSQKSPGETLQASADPSPPNHGVSVLQDHDTTSMPGSPGNSDDQLQGGGVNYQALLDNLSPATSTAPSAENLTSITTAAPSAASN
ncbi:MAG: hypothetical protein L6R41_002076, partial [Letrouitia leprolyta]